MGPSCRADPDAELAVRWHRSPEPPVVGEACLVEGFRGEDDEPVSSFIGDLQMTVSVELSSLGPDVPHPSRSLSHLSVRLRDMAFGQQQGPPASARQVQELLALLQASGHSDFRDARGPMGFTQRQAAGKFTRNEADLFLEQMRDSEPGPRESIEVPTWRRYPREQVLRDIATEHLAVELRRRGCTVVEP